MRLFSTIIGPPRAESVGVLTGAAKLMLGEVFCDGSVEGAIVSFCSLEMVSIMVLVEFCNINDRAVSEMNACNARVECIGTFFNKGTKGRCCSALPIVKRQVKAHSEIMASSDEMTPEKTKD